MNLKLRLKYTYNPLSFLLRENFQVKMVHLLGVYYQLLKISTHFYSSTVPVIAPLKTVSDFDVYRIMTSAAQTLKLLLLLIYVNREEQLLFVKSEVFLSCTIENTLNFHWDNFVNGYFSGIMNNDIQIVTYTYWILFFFLFSQ